MDFKELSDLLGGCVFPDHLSLDLGHVQQILDSYAEAIALQKSDEGYAALRLTKAVLAMRTGDFAGAKKWLAKIAAAESTLSRRWQVRWKAYEYMACCLRRYPWPIRFRPDGSQVSSTISDAIDDMSNAQANMQTMARSLGTQATPEGLLDKIELECILKATAAFNDHLWFEGVLDSDHPNQEQRTLLLNFRKMKGITSQNIFENSLLDRLHSLKLGGTARFFEYLELEVLRACGSTELTGSLDAFQLKFTRSDDAFNKISALIFKADHLYSPATSSPVAYNLMTEGALSGYEIERWDKPDFESQHRLQRNPAADGLYDQAFDLAQRSKCVRALGMIKLRQACVLHAEAMSATESGRSDDAELHLTRAREELGQALHHLRSDPMQHLLTEAHSVLLSISEGDHEEVQSRSERIGSICRTFDNGQLPRFIGVLMIRFGRRQWMDYNRTDIFLMCLACARSCYNGAQDDFGRYQSEVARAKLLCEVNSVNAAHSALQEARVLYDRVIQQCTDVQRSRESYSEALACSKVAIETYFVGVENSIRLKSANPGPAPPISLGLGSILSQEDTDGAQEAANTLARLAAEFSQAVAAALVKRAAADQDGYVARIEEFLLHLRQPYKVRDISVAGYLVRTLCLLERYDEACALMPQAIPPRLGGQAKDDMFCKVTSVKAFGVSLLPNTDHDECKRCIGHAVWAKDWHIAASLLVAVQEQHPKFLSELAATVGPGGSDWQTQTDVAAIYEANDGLSDAMTWYLRARAALEKSRSQAPVIEARLRAMDSLNASSLFHGLIKVCVRFACMKKLRLSDASPNDFGLKGKDWDIQALDFAEQGRARALLDILSLDAADRDIFAKESTDSYALRQYEDLTWNRRPTSKQGADTSTPLRTPPSDAVSVESLFSRVLYRSPNDNAELNDLSFIPSNSLVLHYNSTDDGLVMFALTSQGLARVPRSNLTRQQLSKIVVSSHKEIRAGNKRAPSTGSDGLQNEPGSLLALHLLSPAADLLAMKHHIIFVPDHELNVFPLSSLPFEGEPLGLRKCISQVPSLAVLRQLVSSNSLRSSIRPEVFASQDKGIAMASVAATLIADMLGTKASYLNDLNIAAFDRHFNDATLMHMGTHGLQSSGESPWQARVQFRPDSKKKKKDQPKIGERVVDDHGGTGAESEKGLHVMHLAQLRTNAALDVFSACLSAQGEVSHGNDMIGFSHALLQSGAQCYIGALWNVSDFTAMLMMTLLYRELDAGQNTASVAECLRRAQLQFYKLTMERAMSMLKEAETCWLRPHDGVVQQEAQTWAKTCHDALTHSLQQLKHVNFKDPYHWAAWVVVGHGDVRLIHRPQRSEPSEGEIAPSLPTRPTELVPLHQIHSIDAAGVRTARTPSISVIAASASSKAAESSEEMRPPLPPRPVSEPHVSRLTPTHTPPLVSRKPVQNSHSRPLSVTQRPQSPRPSNPATPVPQTNTKPHPERRPLTPSQTFPTRSRTPDPRNTTERRPQGNQQQRESGPPFSPAQARNDTIEGQQRRRSSQEVRTQQIRQTSNRGSEHPRQQQNAQSQSSNTPQEVQKRSGGRIRRMMQHPGSKIAVRLGTGLLVGGALGAQVGSIYDQWSGAEGTMPGVAVAED